MCEKSCRLAGLNWIGMRAELIAVHDMQRMPDRRIMNFDL
jgi:hypothetical protein